MPDVYAEKMLYVTKWWWRGAESGYQETGCIAVPPAAYRTKGEQGVELPFVLSRKEGYSCFEEGTTAVLLGVDAFWCADEAAAVVSVAAHAAVDRLIKELARWRKSPDFSPDPDGREDEEIAIQAYMPFTSAVPLTLYSSPCMLISTGVRHCSRIT